MPPLTALVVGNGLTVSLMQHGLPGLRDTWPPDKPLSWDVRLADGRTLPASRADPRRRLFDNNPSESSRARRKVDVTLIIALALPGTGHRQRQLPVEGLPL